MTDAVHVPVLLDAALGLLALRPGGRYVDCTLGAGGHAAALLERAGPDSQLLGLDADAEMLAIARERLAPFDKRATLVHANFEELEEVAASEGFHEVDGALFDLGVASPHLNRVERGFSFQGDAPLDMRLDRSRGPTAADLLAELDERELADVIYRLGEEPRSRPIARAIAQARRAEPIRTTGQLAALVGRVVPGGRTNPATRTFQALRIAVNRELDVLPGALRQAHGLLRDGGRLAVISFHSLEDRIVKQYVAAQARPCTCPPRVPICTCGRTARLEPVTRKPITADLAELKRNPRARSAKLRCARRLGPPL